MLSYCALLDAPRRVHKRHSSQMRCMPHENPQQKLRSSANDVRCVEWIAPTIFERAISAAVGRSVSCVNKKWVWLHRTITKIEVKFAISPFRHSTIWWNWSMETDTFRQLHSPRVLWARWPCVHVYFLPFGSINSQKHWGRCDFKCVKMERRPFDIVCPSNVCHHKTLNHSIVEFTVHGSDLECRNVFEQ